MLISSNHTTVFIRKCDWIIGRFDDLLGERCNNLMTLLGICRSFTMYSVNPLWILQMQRASELMHSLKQSQNKYKHYSWYVCAYVYVCTCVYVCMCVCVYTFVYACVCTRVYMCVCVYVHMRVCMCMCVRACMCVCVCVYLCMYVCL